eukprot:NODE_451_length_7265_cov_0.799609.p2 type:complete len:402 gc:universal NODE_451_length_7265_cov_0.799609:1767-562(-)
MLLSLISVYSACTEKRLRKEVRDMSPEEWLDFKTAVKTMQKTGEYQKMAEIHVQVFPKVHGNYVFAQWHRIYLCKFEDAVRKHSKNPYLTIPYYAAWEDADLYGPTSTDKSPVWTEQYYGAGTGSCVLSDDQTIFGTADTDVGGKHCVARQFNHSRAISGSAAINGLVQTPSFHDFSDFLQVGYHAEQHLFVLGDMGQHWSANDPIFMAHHASVDCLYERYQNATGDYDPSKLKENSQKAQIYPEYTYGDAHMNQICCATYQPYQGGYKAPVAVTPTTNFTNSSLPTSTNLLPRVASPTDVPTPSTNGSTQIVANPPASDDQMAKLGISSQQAQKQQGWNDFKQDLAKKMGIPFITDLLDQNATELLNLANRTTSYVTPKEGTSSASLLSFSVFVLVSLFA